MDYEIYDCLLEMAVYTDTKEHCEQMIRQAYGEHCGYIVRKKEPEAGELF